ncbi:hypothetical protein [Vibrio scophthalmi]|uniref:Uncharacterized protein n=1 Tax=Vibrio scophthalmi TaxID=45658 RepID=A0A1E3WJ88_9VIBR|nr:hypothetical protein [Vibrio scophthalmi]ODS09820.1 hypothetical protein VSF3289_00051 [Vibrio scophthalmi]
MAQKIAWSASLIKQFEKAGFTSVIVNELTTLGEVWLFDSLYIVIRSEGDELVWMATLGTGIKDHVDSILAIAKRAGAKTMRFHVADDEKAITRFWRKYQPVEIVGEGFDSGAYRVNLEAFNE